MSLITNKERFTNRLIGVKEGELVLECFGVAETLKIESEIELENKFSFAALEYIYQYIKEQEYFSADNIYSAVYNVYYVTELYLRGFGKEHYMDLEQFIELVKSGRSHDVIEASHIAFKSHIKRLKRIVVKGKKKIPRESTSFSSTRALLEELDQDLSVCERYPHTAINLVEFYFAKYYSLCGPILRVKRSGFLALESFIYALYDELCILSNFDYRDIDKICTKCKERLHGADFNIFERVINNYLFAQIYSETPDSLEISKVNAELLVFELKLGTIRAEELINQLIHKKNISGYNEKYLKEYGEYIQKRIDKFKEMSYFGELFDVV